MQDVDRDGIPDTVDIDLTNGIDSDNDGIDDRFDSSFHQEDDTDGDGIIDSADPDLNGDGFADAPYNRLALGEALPDLNGNDVADLRESKEGFIRTGTQGHGGCTIATQGTGSQRSFDPVFPILISLLSVFWWRRRSATVPSPG